MSNSTPIDRLFTEYNTVISILKEKNEISLQSSAADHFRKTLLLAIASYFEKSISTCVIEFVRERSKGSIRIENFVRNKAVDRQYHTWFDWKAGNANQFFGLFGQEFRSSMNQKVKESDELSASISAFIEVGSERNKLVHQDFATFPMEKTLDEVYALYEKASLFVNSIAVALRHETDETSISQEKR